MNPDIAHLSKLPRGTRWRSRLVPFEADIRRMREAGDSYERIATWLSKQELQITAAAVHSYVRARARRGGCEYRLPPNQSPQQLKPLDELPTAPLLELRREQSKGYLQDAEEFVYKPQENKRPDITEESLGLNDPRI